jgi:hypothetical protein
MGTQEKDMRLKKRNEETKAELAYGSKPKPKTPTKRRLGTEKPSSATTQGWRWGAGKGRRMGREGDMHKDAQWSEKCR